MSALQRKAEMGWLISATLQSVVSANLVRHDVRRPAPGDATSGGRGPASAWPRGAGRESQQYF